MQIELFIEVRDVRKDKQGYNMMCDNCCIAREDIEASHRCRANEMSCIDGKDCPDYINQCDCKDCYITVGT